MSLEQINLVSLINDQLTDDKQTFTINALWTSEYKQLISQFAELHLERTTPIKTIRYVQSETKKHNTSHISSFVKYFDNTSTLIKMLKDEAQDSAYNSSVLDFDQYKLIIIDIYSDLDDYESFTQMLEPLLRSHEKLHMSIVVLSNATYHQTLSSSVTIPFDLTIPQSQSQLSTTSFSIIQNQLGMKGNVKWITSPNNNCLVFNHENYMSSFYQEYISTNSFSYEVIIYDVFNTFDKGKKNITYKCDYINRHSLYYDEMYILELFKYMETLANDESTIGIFMFHDFNITNSRMSRSIEDMFVINSKYVNLVFNYTHFSKCSRLVKNRSDICVSIPPKTLHLNDKSSEVNQTAGYIRSFSSCGCTSSDVKTKYIIHRNDEVDQVTNMFNLSTELPTGMYKYIMCDMDMEDNKLKHKFTQLLNIYLHGQGSVNHEFSYSTCAFSWDQVIINDEYNVNMLISVLVHSTYKSDSNKRTIVFEKLQPSDWKIFQYLFLDKQNVYNNSDKRERLNLLLQPKEYYDSVPYAVTHITDGSITIEQQVTIARYLIEHVYEPSATTMVLKLEQFIKLSMAGSSQSPFTMYRHTCWYQLFLDYGLKIPTKILVEEIYNCLRSPNTEFDMLEILERAIVNEQYGEGIQIDKNVEYFCNNMKEMMSHCKKHVEYLTFSQLKHFLEVFDKIHCRLLSIFDIVKLITNIANISPTPDALNNLHELIALLEKHDYLSDWGYKYCVNDMCSICPLKDMEELWTNYITLQQRVNDMLVGYDQFSYAFKETIPQSQQDDLCYNILMFREIETWGVKITQPKLDFVEYLIEFDKFPLELDSNQIEVIIQGCKTGCVDIERTLEFVKKYANKSVDLTKWITTNNTNHMNEENDEGHNEDKEWIDVFDIPVIPVIPNKTKNIGNKFDKLIELLIELKTDLVISK